MLLNDEYPRRFTGYRIGKHTSKELFTQSCRNSSKSQFIPLLHKLS